MTTLEMKAILTLTETLNFSKAALEMNITQPAFSRMILRVENELGFKLFIRNTRSVELTGEGEAFVMSLRKSYALYTSGIETSRKMLRLGKTLNITCAAEFICLELTPHVVEFRKRHLDVFVECIPTATENIPERLRNRQADIGFFFADREKFNSDFDSEVLKRVPLYVIMHQDNPLAQKTMLEPSDLEKEKIIVLQKNSGAYEIGSYGAPLFLLNKKFGLHLQEGDVAQTTQECLLRVACNQGVMLLAASLNYLLPDDCVMRELNGVDFNFLVLWNKGGLTSWARMFLNYVKQHLNLDLCLNEHK